MIGLLPEKYRHLEERNYETERLSWKRGTKRTCAECGKTFLEKKHFRKNFIALFCTPRCEVTYHARKLRRERAKTIQRTETMQTLYNCKRIDASHYRITKFDDGLVPFQHHDGSLSSYTCTKAGCDCPQGHKPTCRHRKMLPLFIEQEHVDDNYFFVWDTHQWFKAAGIFAEAAKANGKGSPEPTKQQLDAELIEAMNEGGPRPVSAAIPSPQPSPPRMRRF